MKGKRKGGPISPNTNKRAIEDMRKGIDEIRTPKPKPISKCPYCPCCGQELEDS